MHSCLTEQENIFTACSELKTMRSAIHNKAAELFAESINGDFWLKTEAGEVQFSPGLICFL